MLPDAKSHFHLLRRGWERPSAFPTWQKACPWCLALQRSNWPLNTVSQAPRSHFGVCLPLSFSCTQGDHQLQTELKSKQNDLHCFSLHPGPFMWQQPFSSCCYSPYDFPGCLAQRRDRGWDLFSPSSEWLVAKAVSQCLGIWGLQRDDAHARNS